MCLKLARCQSHQARLPLGATKHGAPIGADICKWFKALPAALQTNFRQLLQSHSETLRCVRGFWRVLLSSKASFSALSKVGCDACQES